MLTLYTIQVHWLGTYSPHSFSYLVYVAIDETNATDTPGMAQFLFRKGMGFYRVLGFLELSALPTKVPTYWNMHVCDTWSLAHVHAVI